MSSPETGRSAKGGHHELAGRGKPSDSAAASGELAEREPLLTRGRWFEVGRIVVVGILVFAFWRGWVSDVVLWITVAAGLYPLVKTGVEDLVHDHRVGTEIFVTFATLIALIGGEEVAGAVLMVIILIAEFIAELNTERTRASIRGLIGAAPRTARVRVGSTERIAHVSEVRAGDVVLVRAGDQIPVDGVVVRGNGAVDEATITGESVPNDKDVDSLVFAGTLLESGALDVRTEHVGDDTTFARIITLVEEAEASQAPVQKLADRVAAWLIPVVLIFLILVFVVTGDVRKVVTLMIFTSPAELGLATPIVMVAAIARAAQSGILVKGGIHLETLARVDTVVFDKTGTLTVGRPTVEAITVLDPALDERAILGFAAAADRRSGHPIAQAVVRAAVTAGIEIAEPTAFDSFGGKGVAATVDGQEVLVGNAGLLTEHAVIPPGTGVRDDATPVFVVIGNHPVGIISVTDQPRPRAAEAISRLRADGVQHIAMLTGDDRAVAEHIASQLGIDQVDAELLPEHKVAAITRMQRGGHRVAMVGDGVNDAPALAAADVGIAMGAAGTRAALEAADIALMTDDLTKIAGARAIAHRAYRTIKENLFFGVGIVHVLGIIAALAGLIGPIQAALIHLGPDILVFVNSTKLLRVKLDA